MAKTVEESLLGDHSDQWMDSDCPEAKRIKVSSTSHNIEHLIFTRCNKRVFSLQYLNESPTFFEIVDI